MKIKALALAIIVLGGVAVTAHADKPPAEKVKMKAQNKMVDQKHEKHMQDLRHHHIERGHIVINPLDPADEKSILTAVETRTIPAIDEPTLPTTGTRIVPADVFEVQVDAGTPVIDAAQQQYDRFYYNAYKGLRALYNPAVYGQYSLPADIATMEVGRVKTGVLSLFNVFGKKDKLSVYLSQHKPAMRLYGLYEQRLIAWHKGRAPAGVTVERAINREAHHPFLDTVITSNATSLDMLKYLDGRLSARDSDMVRAWLLKHQDEEKTMPVIEIIANGIAQQKTDSLYLR